MNIDGKSTLTEDGKGINSQLDYTVNSLKLQNQDIGSGKLTLKLANRRPGVASVQPAVQRRSSGADGESAAGAES
jgi:hypothetical protein